MCAELGLPPGLCLPTLNRATNVSWVFRSSKNEKPCSRMQPGVQPETEPLHLTHKPVKLVMEASEICKSLHSKTDTYTIIQGHLENEYTSSFQSHLD